MKPFSGVTRITLRQRDGVIFCINDPEVFRSDGDGKSFCAFGKLQVEDQNMRMQQAEAKKFAEQTLAGAQSQQAAAPQKADAGSEAAESEDGITASHIDM